MGQLRVKNWERFQHFKDRHPVWVKLYREILDDFEINSLSAEAFKFLIQIWLIASDDPKMEGNLPSIEAISFRLRINKNKCLDLLDQIDNFLISEEHQQDIPRALAREEKEKEKEKEEEKKPSRDERHAANEDFLEGLKKNPAYAHINFEIEIGKMREWLSLPRNKRRQFNRQFVLNWLNRIEQPLSLPQDSETKQRQESCVVCGFYPWSVRRDGKAYCSEHSSHHAQNAPPGPIGNLVGQLANSFGAIKS